MKTLITPTPIEGQTLVSIWRAEAQLPVSHLHHANPFNGVETYLFDTEKEAEAVIDKLAAEHPNWKFATEPLTRWPY